MAESEGKVADLKEKMTNAKAKGLEKLQETGEVIREKAKVVDDKVHNDPWPIIGGAFVTGILLGFILGKKE